MGDQRGITLPELRQDDTGVIWHIPEIRAKLKGRSWPMFHVLLFGLSGVALCAGMALLTDRLAAEFFRMQESAGNADR
ncbi:MAG TPA: hypothetical protein VKV02_13490 [Acidobacteriaceae bacterium]|nr:hypothetical protein [Acidobacteriaceae bacterium]